MLDETTQYARTLLRGLSQQRKPNSLLTATPLTFSTCKKYEKGYAAFLKCL